MALDEAGGAQWMRASNRRRAQVHLKGDPALAREGAQAVDNEVAERLPLFGRRALLSPGAARERPVRLVEAEVAVVGEGVLQRELVSVAERVGEALRKAT